MTPLTLALPFAFACFGLGLVLNLWRLVIGPGAPDRILALDTMVVNVIALLTLHGIASGTGVLFEATLLFAMTGFVGSVAYARHLLRGEIVE